MPFHYVVYMLSPYAIPAVTLGRTTAINVYFYLGTKKRANNQGLESLSQAFIASTNNSRIPFNNTANSLVSFTRSSTRSTFCLSSFGLQWRTS